MLFIIRICLIIKNNYNIFEQMYKILSTGLKYFNKTTEVQCDTVLRAEQKKLINTLSIKFLLIEPGALFH